MDNRICQPSHTPPEKIFSRRLKNRLSFVKRFLRNDKKSIKIYTEKTPFSLDTILPCMVKYIHKMKRKAGNLKLVTAAKNENEADKTGGNGNLKSFTRRQSEWQRIKSHLTTTEKIMLGALIFEVVKWLVTRLLGG
jgi:hypothetical protein